MSEWDIDRFGFFLDKNVFFSIHGVKAFSKSNNDKEFLLDIYIEGAPFSLGFSVAWQRDELFDLLVKFKKGHAEKLCEESDRQKALSQAHVEIQNRLAGHVINQNGKGE